MSLPKKLIFRFGIAVLQVFLLPSADGQETIRYITIDFENFAPGTELRDQLAGEGLHFSAGQIVSGSSTGGNPLNMDGFAGPQFLFLEGPLILRSDFPVIGISQRMAAPASSDFVYQAEFQSVHWDYGGRWNFSGSGNFGERHEFHYNAYTLQDGVEVQSIYGIDELKLSLVIPEPSSMWIIGVGGFWVVLRKCFKRAAHPKR